MRSNIVLGGDDGPKAAVEQNIKADRSANRALRIGGKALATPRQLGSTPPLSHIKIVK